MVVNHPKEIIYEKIISYINQKGWKVISSVEAEKISFQTNPTFISISIDFGICLTPIDEKSTMLSVSSGSGQLDCGRSKGIIYDMLKESFDMQSNAKACFDSKSYKSWSKLVILVSVILVIVFSLRQLNSSYYYDESWDETYEEEMYEDTYGESPYNSETTLKQQETNKPSWLIGSWRAPIGDTGVLIVNLYPNDADIKIMNGFTLINKIDYDGWTIFDNMVYLASDGEKLKDSPSFYIDYENRRILGHSGERFQKH